MDSTLGMEHNNRGPGLMDMMIVLLTIAWITFLMRTYVRVIMLKSFGLDDWFMAVTMISCTIWQSMQFVGIDYGLGAHLWDISSDDMQQARKYWWLSEPGYALTTLTLKLALGFFIIRVAIQPLHVKIVWLVMILSSTFGLAFFFLIVFQCHPMSSYWMNVNAATDGSCLSSEITTSISYAHAAVSAFTDLTLGILPLFIVWPTTMPTRMKVVVVLILGFGSLGSIATLIRIPAIKLLTNDTDFLYVAAELAYFSTIEPFVGIIAGNLATLRPLVQLWQSQAKSRSTWARRLYTSADSKSPCKESDPTTAQTSTAVTGASNQYWFEEIFRSSRSAVTIRDLEHGIAVVTHLDDEGFPVSNEQLIAVSRLPKDTEKPENGH